MQLRCSAVRLGRTPSPATAFAIDVNACAAEDQQSALDVAGTLVDCQWWSRDPASPSTTSSDALELVEP